MLGHSGAMSLDCVDYSLFMGMHSADERTRVACKNYFVGSCQKRCGMSLENIGICDALVWSLPRKIQDAYYPFMDTLHTVATIEKLAYTDVDLRAALDDPRLRSLLLQDRLSVAMAMNMGGTLFTMRQTLLGQGDLPVREPSRSGAERAFSPMLEALYQNSLQLMDCVLAADDWICRGRT